MARVPGDGLKLEALLERAAQVEPGAAFEFLGALRVLAGALEREARLTPAGRGSVAAALVAALVNQARVRRNVREHPVIERVAVDRAVFIIGLMRSGTTFLHNLLAQHPGLRCPSLWELATPAGPRGDGPCAAAAAACESSMQELYRSAPGIRAIHPFDTWRPDECHRLLGNAFESRVFWARYDVPSYVEWLEEQDLRPAYEYHRLQLKNILWRIPGDVPLMKCPFHLWSLKALTDAYPSARFIYLHRDPAAVVASLSSLCAALRAARSDRVDHAEIGRFWTEQIGALLSTITEVRRGCLAARPVLDLRYDEAIRDPLGVMHRICRFLDVPMTEDAVGRASGFLANDPLRQYGVHSYAAEQFGLDHRALQDRFAAYRREWDV
jgi:Sulfotransferase family